MARFYLFFILGCLLISCRDQISNARQPIGEVEAIDIDNIPVLSQFKSLFQFVSGDPAGAKKTQETFADNLIDRADTFITAINREFKPIAEIVKLFDPFGGVPTGKPGRNRPTEPPPLPIPGFGLPPLKPSAKLPTGSPNPLTPEIVGPSDAGPSLGSGNVPAPGIGPLIADDHQSTLNDENRIEDQVAQLSGKPTSEVKYMPDSEKLRYLQNSLVHLPADTQRAYTLYDFMDVNRLRGEANCYLCTLAGNAEKRISRLAKLWNETPANIRVDENMQWDGENNRDSTPDEVLRLFRDTEFPRATMKKFENHDQITEHLTRTLIFLPNNAIYKFGFAYLGTSSGHIISGKAWLDGNGQLKTAFTDFQSKPENIEYRYTQGLPEPGLKHFYIYDLGANGWDLMPRVTSASPVESSPGCQIMCKQGDKASAAMSEQIARTGTGGATAASLAKRIGPIELLDLNDGVEKGVVAAKPCWWCVTALFAGSTVSTLGKSTAVELKEPTLRGPSSVQEVLNLYKHIGYPGATIITSGSEQEIRKYLGENLVDESDSKTRVVLAYNQPHLGTTNQVLLSAWLDERSKSVQMLITDYQYAPDDVRRYKKSLSELEGAPATMHLIQPRRVNPLTSEAVERDLAGVSDTVLARGTGCPHKSRRLIGYVASWSKRPFSVEQASRYTNLIFAFVQMDANGNLKPLSSSSSQQRLIEMAAARKALSKRGHHLALSFAVGGWTNSEHFSSVLGDSSRRATFIKSICSLIKLDAFDGVDIDWEYPGTGGATEGRKEDRENYVSFLRELRAQLPAGKLLSIAGGAGEEAMRGFDIARLTESLDWIGVMTYDFNGAWDSKWGAYVGPNAPLGHAAPPGYSGKLNANWAIKQYVCRSNAPAKIVLGLPFYGRYWSRTQPRKSSAAAYPLFREAQLSNGGYGGEISYNLIEDYWFNSGSQSRGAKRHWDELSSTPWAIDEKSTAVLTYDNARSLAAKVDYALKHNLGGVMVWSVDQDDFEMTLSSQVGKMCAAPTGSSIESSFKCNPLGEERRWWTWSENQTNAGLCGRNAPLYNGFYAHCDPDDPGYGCCGKFGYCGSGDEYCNCPECIDYAKDLGQLVKEPTKPSRPIQWHLGFTESLGPGQPRCGKNAPPLNDHLAICNPDNERQYCCSESGFCGVGAEYCDCAGCKNFRNLSIADSMVRARKPDEIRWHTGFKVVKPGEPRCGPKAPKVRDQEAICDPDDGGAHCCAPSGYCGSTRDFCDCKGCVDARKL